MGHGAALRWRVRQQLLLVSGGSRPAFLLPSDYTVEVEGNPLEQYSTRELAEELFRRIGK